MPSKRDIAIVGMSALFPGARDARTFWRNIVNKVDAISDAPSRWIVDNQFGPGDHNHDTVYTRRGGFLHELTTPDPLDAGITFSLPESDNPDHYLAIRLASEALRDAGYLERPFPRDKTGIIIGRGSSPNRDYETAFQQTMLIPHMVKLIGKLSPHLSAEQLQQIHTELKASLPPLDTNGEPVLLSGDIAGCIANGLDLMGPHFELDAACSSSLFAVDLAMKELRSGNCDMMLAGGINTLLSLPLCAVFCQIQALSRSSSIKPFDIDADGTLLSEGLGFVVLKRAEDAVRDGDRVYAVIKQVGTSSDGKAMGLPSPRSEGQVAAMQRAYANSGIDPQAIELLEAHGTGIRLGDETEVDSVKQVFGSHRDSSLPRLAMGSVKSMIGHALPAAGMASLVKTAFAIHQKVLPPTLCGEINPDLKLTQSPIYMNTEARPWIHGRPAPRQAAISTFGFGGANAHALLEEAPEATTANNHESLHVWDAELFLFSGRDRQALGSAIERLRQMTGQMPEARLADLAYATCTGHDQGGEHRLALIAQDLDDLASKLVTASEQLQKPKPVFRPRDRILYASGHSEGKTAFIFPGQGSQYPDMLADLCMIFPEVRKWFDFLDRVYLQMGREEIPSQLVFPAPTCLDETDRKRIDDEFFSIETGANVVLVASIALFELLKKFSIPCDAMAGHSTGEATAMIASGLFGDIDEERLGQLIKASVALYQTPDGEAVIPEGAMLSIGAIDPKRLANLLETTAGKVVLALDNCPNQMVLFGQEQDVKALMPLFEQEGAHCEFMPFGYAIHTPMAEPMQQAFLNTFESIPMFEKRHELYSCVSAKPFPLPENDAKMQASRLCDHPVRFHGMIRQMYTDGFRHFIEVGPRGNSIAFIRDILAGQPHMAVAVNSHLRSGIAQLEHLLAEFFVRGIAMDPMPLFEGRGLQRLDLTKTASPPESQELRLDFSLPLADLPEEVVQSLASGDRPAAPATAPRAKSGEEQATVLQNHFEMMQAFLTSQERLLDLLQLSGQAPASSQATRPQPDKPVRAPLPMLGRIVQQVPDKLTSERIVDIRHDIYLKDHAFGSKPSRQQAHLSALPVVPFTMSMETCAEAALALAGNDESVVTELFDIRALRWIALDNESLTLRIEALRLQGGENDEHRVLVRIFSLENGGKPALAFEAKVVVANGYRPSPALTSPEKSASIRNRYTPETLYNDGVPRDPEHPGEFHGPRFQAVRQILDLDDNGIRAEQITMPTDRFLSDTGKPDMLLDPVMIDASMHLTAYWLTEKYDVDVNILPFRAESYEQFSPPPAAGEKIIVRARIGFVRTAGGELPDDACYRFLDTDGNEVARAPLMQSGHFTAPPAFDAVGLWPEDLAVESNVEFISGEGTLIARMRRRQDRHFTVPARYDRFILYPNYRYISEITESGDQITASLASLPDSFLLSSGGIWLRKLAYMALRREEMAQLRHISDEALYIDRLMRIIAAKELARAWLLRSGQLHYATIDISIRESDGEFFTAQPFDREQGEHIPRISVKKERNLFVAKAITNGDKH